MITVGKFDGKADEGFFVGYSLNSKAFRVFNSRTRIVEENLDIRYSESIPNVVGSGPDWIFDIDALTRIMNYEPIVVGTQSNGFAEAVNTACYVQNRVLIVKPQNKTPYEFFHGRTPTLSFMRSFGCPVTILSTINHLGKFDGKADEVYACARYQVNPKVSHLHAVKRIFRYLKGQPKLDLWYLKKSLFDLVAYTDSDYVGARLDRKSTTGGCQFLRCRLISWQCKKQTVVENSTTEAEYVAASSCCGQVLWIQTQLLDYREDLEDLYKLVKAKFKSTRPVEDLDLLL
nr:uncharacterized mitochondrial protein AtMg00810-like [Tanacetum cinerariifolium]